MSSSTVTVEIATEVTEELLAGLTHLLPQLSSSAPPPTHADLAEIVGSVVLVGVGGIASGAHAYAKIRAGANLVQLYTALVYEGPGLVSRIKSELAECLTRDGYDSVAEAVGVDA